MVTVADQLDRNVDRTGGTFACWLWTAAIGGNGYGSFRADGRTHRAHRAAYEAEHGRIPPGLMVLHICDVKLCCNPRHLYAGTRIDNARDREVRGPERVTIGDRNGRAKLTAEQVAEIRSRYRAGARQIDLAAAFGIAQTQVSRIVRGERWAS